MRAKYILAIKKRIVQYVSINYQKLDENRFVLGKLLYNYKCHLNAVQSVREEKSRGIYLCILTSKKDWKEVFIHFINKTSWNKFQDNTLGFTYEDFDYYLIKELDEKEYADSASVRIILEDTRRMLMDLFSNKFIRKILKIDNTFI